MRKIDLFKNDIVEKGTEDNEDEEQQLNRNKLMSMRNITGMNPIQVRQVK